MKPLKPIMFWVDNDRDQCSFCSTKGKLLKSMSTGKNTCPKCIEFLSDEIIRDDIKEDCKLLTDSSNSVE